MKWAILLKFSYGRPIHKNPVEEILNKNWKISNPAIFYKMERNLLTANFITKDDQDRVLNGGPWSFGGNTILMQKWETGMMEDDFDNTKINI